MVQTYINFFHLRMLCTQFGWNKASDSGIKKLLNVTIYLLFSVLGKRRDLHMISFQLSPSFLTSVVEIGPAVLNGDFYMLLFCNYFLGVRPFIWRNVAHLWGKITFTWEYIEQSGSGKKNLLKLTMHFYYFLNHPL